MGLSLMNLIRQVVSVAFEHNPYQPIIRFIYEVTEPYLRIFRRIVPPYGAVDFSPIVAFIALRVIEWIVIRILYYITPIMY
jgi:YggT family protein